MKSPFMLDAADGLCTAADFFTDSDDIVVMRLPLAIAESSLSDLSGFSPTAEAKSLAIALSALSAVGVADGVAVVPGGLGNCSKSADLAMPMPLPPAGDSTALATPDDATASVCSLLSSNGATCSVKMRSISLTAVTMDWTRLSLPDSSALLTAENACSMNASNAVLMFSPGVLRPIAPSVCPVGISSGRLTVKYSLLNTSSEPSDTPSSATMPSGAPSVMPSGVLSVPSDTPSSDSSSLINSNSSASKISSSSSSSGVSPSIPDSSPVMPSSGAPSSAMPSAPPSSIPGISSAPGMGIPPGAPPGAAPPIGDSAAAALD